MTGPGRPPTTRLRATTPAAEPAVPPKGPSATPVLLAGLVVLAVLAAWLPPGVALVVGLPLALTVPGTVLQTRFLPGLRTDHVTRWCLRVALAVGAWTLVVTAAGLAGIPVRSAWPVLLGVVLFAAVLTLPAASRPPVTGRAAALVALGAVVAVGVGAGALGLARLADRPRAATGVVVAFADAAVPVSLAATGASAQTTVRVSNPGTTTVVVAVGVTVGRGLPWKAVTVDLAAGASRTVALTGGVDLCAQDQQLAVTVDDAAVGPAAVLPATPGTPDCGSA